MKIGIRKDLGIIYGIGAMSFALIGGASVVAYQGVQKDAEYLKQNAPEKYEYLKSKYGVQPYRGSAEHWYTVAQMHRDSVASAQKIKIDEELKLDSIAKANYALGMQAVRDSLANTNNK